MENIDTSVPKDYGKGMFKLQSANNAGKVTRVVSDILKDIYELEERNLHRECSMYITRIAHLSIGYNTHILEGIFRGVDFKRLSDWSLIALLRNTIYNKDKLPRWYDILEYTIQYYKQNELDERDLIGLNELY